MDKQDEAMQCINSKFKFTRARSKILLLSKLKQRNIGTGDIDQLKKPSFQMILICCTIKLAKKNLLKTEYDF